MPIAYERSKNRSLKDSTEKFSIPRTNYWASRDPSTRSSSTLEKLAMSNKLWTGICRKRVH